jgi:hypothetical protein
MTPRSRDIPASHFLHTWSVPNVKQRNRGDPPYPVRNGGLTPRTFQNNTLSLFTCSKKGECQGESVVTLKPWRARGGPWNNTEWDFLSHHRHCNTLSPSFPDAVKQVLYSCLILIQDALSFPLNDIIESLVQHKMLVFYADANSWRMQTYALSQRCAGGVMVNNWHADVCWRMRV